MSVLKTCLGILVGAAFACEATHAQEELMDFSGRERPGLMMIEASGLTRFRPDLSESEKFITTVNFIGEGFLDVETALPSPDLAAHRPKVTPDILAVMDDWTNEYGRPWSVASYGGPLTPERMLAHTVRFNIGNILYAPYYSMARIRLEVYMLSFKSIAEKYFIEKCPIYRNNVTEILDIDSKKNYSNDLSIYKYDWKKCHHILYGWLRRNVSETAYFGSAAAIGELFAWYHSPAYTPGDLPQEVVDIISNPNTDSGDYWNTFKYEGKRYEDIKRDLMVNLERVNAGWLPDSPEAGVADYGTMLFLIATGRLLPPATEESAARP